MYNAHSIIVPGLMRNLTTAVFLLLALAGLPLSGYCAELNTIYFYNPEVNTTRSVILKSTFDQYLKENSNLHFQPVNNKKTFEALIRNDREATFIMSSWHYQQLKSTKHPLVTALRGIKNKRDSYRKILVSKLPNVNSQAITIAISGTIEYSRSILSSIYPDHSPDALSKLNILIVPKDIDALMAVGFDLADAAVTTQTSLEKLSTLYKNQHQQLNILGESAPLKRLVVIHHPGKTDTIDVLKQMNKSEKGQQCLHMLGLDDWQTISAEQSRNRRSKQ